MNKPETQSVFIKVDDYATFAGITAPTVYAWIKSGRIPKENVKTVLNMTLVKKVIV
jgi:predicted DNA-binding transcriptional regulator AlpA